jgi:hypothetical protein
MKSLSIKKQSEVKKCCLKQVEKWLVPCFLLILSIKSNVHLSLCQLFCKVHLSLSLFDQQQCQGLMLNVETHCCSVLLIFPYPLWVQHAKVG